ncbi:MAG: hypothetical protein HC888_07810 [Candidatus Competibacteraceae bacterium]|nr:hypothetical protein [Candidatus Competibacteraceae bacterium]
MCRIYAPNVKIEHWHSQKKHPLEQLDYGNLLCCCMGSEGSPQKSQHCDTRKRDRDILYNPSNPGHHMKLKIRYDGAGKIRSDSNAFERDINDVLNLNTRQLMRNRIEVIQEVQRKLGPTPGLRKKTEIEKLLRRWRATDSSGRLAPYCDVAIDYLLKHPSVRDSKSK